MLFFGGKLQDSYSVKLNSSLLLRGNLPLDFGYFSQVFYGLFHVLPASPLHWVDAELSAALDNPDVMVSDWDVLPFNRVRRDEHVISDLNGLLFILLNDQSQVLNLSLSDDCGSFGLLVSWRGFFGLNLRLVDNDGQLPLSPWWLDRWFRRRAVLLWQEIVWNWLNFVLSGNSTLILGLFLNVG